MFKRHVLILVLMVLAVSLAGAKGRDDFLGTWALKDNANDIKIIKEGELYYVIEFVHIKHELYFSGDGRQAVFIEWGKGPGWDTMMYQLERNVITETYFSEGYRWKATQYIYYKVP